MNSVQYYGLAQQRALNYQQYTAAQQRAAEAAQAEQLRIYKEQARKNDEARAKAHDLLLSHLTLRQQTTFKKNKWFVVEGGRSKTNYRIRDIGHCSGNIEVLSGEKVTHRLCCHPDGIPLYDVLLAQKIMLQYDEERFLKIANRHAA